MTEKLSIEFIIRFDEALDKYMKSAFPADGNTWRHRCHRSAKIASRSICMLLGEQSAQLVRVQLKAKMANGPSFVDLGNPDDPRIAEGRYPMHWAVRIGSSLYDPTSLWQLRRAKTQLDLPPEPYFFAQDFFKIAKQHEDGGFLVSYDGPRNRLFLNYKIISERLPDDMTDGILPDGLVRKHARKVISLFV